MKNYDIEKSLEDLSKTWDIEPEIYDLHLGKRGDVTDVPMLVDDVVFHIPKLCDDGLFVFWECLWPACHNCCEKQGRLPLTKDDLNIISKKMNYDSVAKFVENETTISSWDEKSYGNLITSISMISLKRSVNETPEQDGTPLKCQFLDSEGSCTLHPQKPGVCSLYPFASWIESDKGMVIVHATFQFTGDCPGFYLSKDINDGKKILKEYSKMIYDYNMSISRSVRENYSFINIS